MPIDMEAWFKTYSSDVYSYLLYATGLNDVDDLVQETFIKAIKGLHTYRGDASPKTWLLSIARNIATDGLRQRNKMPQPYEAEWFSMVPEQGSNPVEQAEVSDLKLHLRSAIQTLKPSYRSVIILKGILELTNTEAAATLGWNEVKVRVTFHRGLKALRKYLSEADFRGISEWVR